MLRHPRRRHLSQYFTDPSSPYVILNDFGGAFSMGAIGGGIWHGIKGARNSPKASISCASLWVIWLTAVQGERLLGSLSAIKARAPVLGGNFGIWGGLFSSFDCAVKGYRQKEDPWNAIISGFMTGGTLAIRCESRDFPDERLRLVALQAGSPTRRRIDRCSWT